MGIATAGIAGGVSQMKCLGDFLCKTGCSVNSSRTDRGAQEISKLVFHFQDRGPKKRITKNSGLQRDFHIRHEFNFHIRHELNFHIRQEFNFHIHHEFNFHIRHDFFCSLSDHCPG